MELGKIKARIREKGCNPSIPMVVPGSNQVLWVKVQKSALMDELDKVFPTKVSETGLMFDGDKLTPVKVAAPIPATKVAVAEDDDLLGCGNEPDADDLLGDDLLAEDEEDDDLLA